MINSFPSEVAERLQTYVYRLIDPRNGETFYVGKGKGDRVFYHVAAELVSPEISDKLTRIREIRDAGFEVAHVIHRHGLSDEIAFHVEAALIDAYPGLTNIAGGVGNDDIGVMHSRSIVEEYTAATAEFHHRILAINLNQTYADRSIYEQVRFCWRLNVEKAREAEYVLAVRQGMIRGVFVAHEWHPATTEYFPEYTTVPERWAFNGQPAPDDIQSLYLNKRIPDRFRKRGASNPIRYISGDIEQTP